MGRNGRKPCRDFWVFARSLKRIGLRSSDRKGDDKEYLTNTVRFIIIPNSDFYCVINSILDHEF